MPAAGDAAVSSARAPAAVRDDAAIEHLCRRRVLDRARPSQLGNKVSTSLPARALGAAREAAVTHVEGMGGGVQAARARTRISSAARALACRSERRAALKARALRATRRDL